ncbi:MAG TPA: hypothetical protein VG759_06115 [Candidatus Angelobacter sp.]|nr:hypothetical protein [Candidatus Angelobacter sp.]
MAMEPALSHLWAYGPPKLMKMDSSFSTIESAWNREGPLHLGSVEAVTEYGPE